MSPRGIKVLLLLASAVGLGWLLVTLKGVLFPVLLALLLAYLLDPLVVGLMRLRLSRPRAIAVLYGAGLAVVVVFLVVGVPWAARQGKALDGRLSELARSLPAWGEKAVTWTEQRTGLKLGLEPEAKTLAEKTRDWILKHPVDVRSLSGGALDITGSGLKWMLAFATTIALVPIYAYFFLLGLDRLPGVLRDLLPVSYREKGMSVLTQIHQTMASFFRGRLLICGLKGVVAAVGMTLGGVPLGALVGLGSGAMSLVPFLAFPAGSILGCSFALLDGQGLHGVLWVLGSLSAAELLEAVANPWLLGRQMALHPAVVLFSLFVGGKLLGAMGLLLSVPMASAVKILWQELLFPWWRELADRTEGT